MDTGDLYESFKLATQRLQLEVCFAKPSHDSKVGRVLQEVTQLFTSEELQKRLREKRGCA